MAKAEVCISMPVSVVFCEMEKCIHQEDGACGRLWVKVNAYRWCDNCEEKEEKDGTEAS